MVAVNESVTTPMRFTSLKDRAEPAALFSYALALKRAGLYDEALTVYHRLLRLNPDTQASAYVNIGNVYVGLNNMEEALQSYQRRSNLRPLASAYYNLSAVSRELLDYEKGNEYYRKALEIDRDAVSRYQAVAARTPNRIVADETLSYRPSGTLQRKPAAQPLPLILLRFPYGQIPFAACVLIIAFYYLSTTSRTKAYRCRRCNSIFCPHCEQHIMLGTDVLPVLSASLVKLDETEVKERVARSYPSTKHQKRRRGIMRMLSFLLPGASQIFGGRVLYGLLLMWPFLFLLLLPFTNAYLSSGPLISHWVVNSFSLLFAACIYVISNIFTRQRIAKGWL